MAEEKAYTQAASTGKYDKSSGLLGKYDNVRRFWEDRLTGAFLCLPINDLVEYKTQRMDRIRILDLGCGSGDGYKLLMDVDNIDKKLSDSETAVISPDILKEYVGLDINDELLKQAEEHYGRNPKLRFIKEDLSDGLPASIRYEKPFDIYSTSYGTLSHFHDEQCVKLISDICEHTEHKSIFIGDWLGRYSYEWQDLWHHPVDKEYFMDYRISYIFPEEERDKADIATFPLRLMTSNEINEIIKKAEAKSGAKIKPLAFFDRSILVGRHMDTGEYNKNCPRMRCKINSLFENNIRTDLEDLLVDFVPREGFTHLNNFFEMFFMSCNTLIEYTIKLLNDYDSPKGGPLVEPEILPHYPDSLKESMFAMRQLVEGIGRLKWSDVRANYIEPHLAYSLRKLEIELQPGTGVGHSLAGVFEIVK